MLLIAYCPEYVLPLPAGHRFPMAKYALIPEQLLYEGTISPAQLIAPAPADPTTILRVHDAQYYHRLCSLGLSKIEVRRSGFPLTPELVTREHLITQGTLRCAEWALTHGCALNVAGGTHHAYADRAEGFCLLNDQAIAAQWLLDTGRATRILILDLDVHQGNGTARIFAHEPRVFTFSMHGAGNYPHPKEQSDLDVPLPDGTTDGEYLRLLRDHLPRVLAAFQPDFVFYLSGVDVLATDRLGRLGMTLAGTYARDSYVFHTMAQCDLPVVVCMGGGYSLRLADIVNAHCQTFRLAQAFWG
jgi:acetoin utilization deacetylase AcuC-like enzyme